MADFSIIIPAYNEEDSLRAFLAEVIAFCRERIAGYKCPKVIRELPVLPRTAAGKVDKPALRAGWGNAC